MTETMVNATEALDRHLFSAGMVLTIILSGMKLFGIVDWPWRWTTSPVWLWIMFTCLRSFLIVRPWKKRMSGKPAKSPPEDPSR